MWRQTQLSRPIAHESVELYQGSPASTTFWQGTAQISNNASYGVSDNASYCGPTSWEEATLASRSTPLPALPADAGPHRSCMDDDVALHEEAAGVSPASSRDQHTSHQMYHTPAGKLRCFPHRATESYEGAASHPAATLASVPLATQPLPPHHQLTPPGDRPNPPWGRCLQQSPTRLKAPIATGTAWPVPPGAAVEDLRGGEEDTCPVLDSGGPGLGPPAATSMSSFGESLWTLVSGAA